MRTARWLGAWALAAVALGTAPVKAQNIDFTGEIELRAVESELDADEGEEIDSSGLGARAAAGAAWQAGKATFIAVEFDLAVFDYREDARPTRESYGAAISVSQALSKELSVDLRARRAENIAVLEALSADQTSLGAQIQWESGKDRVRLAAEWRKRQYDTLVPANGDGLRFDGQYNHRFAPYHWLRIDLRHEDMSSDSAPLRSFERQVARVKYSQPITRSLRLRPYLEWRQWRYDTRVAEGDPQGDRRRDHFIAPGLDLSWGRETRGFFGVAGGEYRLRSSNDVRYGADAARFDLRVGYRF